MGPKESVADSVVQSLVGPLSMSPPVQSFEGMYNYWGVSPPDPDGDVGPSNYVQMVNSGFTVYDKSGNVLYGPANTNTIWSGFGGPCEARNDGDPIVLYDQLADRWMLSQFTSASPYYECIAVSATPDPTGGYYRYAFQVSPVAFEDYPHFGVWPDGYYMTANEFPNGAANDGAGVFAFERDKMLTGQPADMIYFHLNLPYVGLLPADLEGYTPPPAGSPNFILGLQRTLANQLHMFKFDVVTWDPPAADLNGPYPISVASWDEDLCATTREACIPQPNNGPALEAIADRLMYRLVYRNFPDHESLIANHTVDSTTPAGRAGIRWYEIRNPSATTPTLYQQGTYAPADGDNRWMGSIAMDRLGNIALGFSASNASTTYPTIRYAGRLVTDTLGLLAQGETDLVTGTGVQTGSARWGDYTSLHVDPDECTFWYTDEYYNVSTFNGWRTRIGSFRFPNCAPVCGVADVVTGSITMSDSTQTSAVVGGITSTCSTTQTCPGMSSFPNPRHTDVYTYTNTSGSTQCVTVNLDATGCGNGGVSSVAYLGSFNPATVCTNYLASAPAGPNVTYSFKVPAGATYVVVVRETNIDAGCASYALSVNPSCGVVPEGSDTATPTSTSIIDTPTATAVTTSTGTTTATALPSATSTEAPSSTSIATVTAEDTKEPTSTANTVPSETSTSTAAVPSNTSTSTVQAVASSTQTSASTNTATTAPSSTTTTAPSSTRTSTAVASSTRTATSASSTSTPNATATACAIKFADVPPTGEGSTFYGFVRCLACRHIVSGYPCGGPGEDCNDDNDPYYRPGANVTRGQLSKIIANSAGLNDTPAEGQQQFADVPPGSPFYEYAERLAQTGAIAGYPCGGPGVTEPCDPEGRPYFRPNNPATRGQISKIVSIAAGFNEDVPDGQQTFTDVATDSPFWVYIERLASRGVISGYGEESKCPETGAPCFRYNDNTTRGQMAKIAANTFFPNCNTPARR
jgi:hypothetical protein